MNSTMSLRFNSIQLAVVGLIVATTASLSIAADGLDLAAQQARLQLLEQSPKAEEVTSVQQQLVAAKRDANVPKSRDVIVTGQIGGVPNIWPDTHPNFPWYKGQASFFLVDSKVASRCSAHTKQHGKQVCVYCQRQAAKNAHAVAVVNFVDEQGKVLTVGARELLGLKANQTVTIRGKAKLLGGSLLVIDADGIYLPPVNVANQSTVNSK